MGGIEIQHLIYLNVFFFVFVSVIVSVIVIVCFFVFVLVFAQNSFLKLGFVALDHPHCSSTAPEQTTFANANVKKSHAKI